MLLLAARVYDLTLADVGVNLAKAGFCHSNQLAGTMNRIESK